MLRRQYVSVHDVDCLQAVPLQCTRSSKHLVGFMQIVALSDEENWRNGLIVRLLNACSVNITSAFSFDNCAPCISYLVHLAF